MTNDNFWSPDQVKSLRKLFLKKGRSGKLRPVNQAEFGQIIGGYRQATISLWENEGCTSRRGCSDLQGALERVGYKEPEAIQ